MLWKSLIALCVIGAALAEQTPVFLWGANSVAKPSLRTVPQAEFADQLAELLKDHMVVAFEENGLSTKDFLCANSQSQSCYAKLQGVSPKTYYTSVENPSEALRSVAAKREHNSIDASGRLVSPAKCSVGTALFVSFEDDEETREVTLESHDSAIAAISKQLDCKVAYLYLAAPSTAPVVQRRTRRDTAATTGGIMWVSGNQFRMFYTSVQYNGVPFSVNSLTITNGTTPATKFSVTLATADPTKSLTFDVLYGDGGYFSLTNVAYAGQNFRSTGIINAPTTFSYACGNLTLETAAVDNMYNTLSFNSLQIQAPFSSTYKENFVFGDSWDCVGFVSTGILMGLFVVVIFLIIIFIGVCWMMDINTMDRFDDPKGKTITINAGAE
ncbi:V-type proton ATPase subunit S1 [Drosophila subobscura]|uniref:V-type proton ATPase subunit S1 n=1 Tax=Drosophila subobscura TaxID=7241 RepID=UPI00155A0EA8|nr:V-type proton ATPase subunit S1 [Drosophila subobscura]